MPTAARKRSSPWSPWWPGWRLGCRLAARVLRWLLENMWLPEKGRFAYASEPLSA